jgi:hypothetical protein
MGRLERNTRTLKTYHCPIIIKEKIKEKRKPRTNWHRLRTLEAKDYLTQHQKYKKNNKVRRVRRADNLTTICEPIV